MQITNHAVERYRERFKCKERYNQITRRLGAFVKLAKTKQQVDGGYQLMTYKDVVMVINGEKMLTVWRLHD